MKKSELIESLEEERAELQEMLEDLPDTVLLEPVMGSWTIKDILNHLTYWEGQTVTLLYQAMRGVPKPTTAHFSSESVDTLNLRWYEEGKARSLEMVWNDWLGVRKQLIRRVNELPEEDLNNPTRFTWLKEMPLADWIINECLDHEEEHADVIREWLDEHDSPTAGSNGYKG